MSNKEAKPDRSWQEIASEAARVSDPTKLLELSNELALALDQRRKILNTEVTYKPSSFKKKAG